MTSEKSQNNRLAIGIFIEDEITSSNVRLEETIRSARILSERIYIIERESSDRTKQIADSENLSDRLVSADGEIDNSAARNTLIDMLEKNSDADWILWMNAGECFDESTREAFRCFLDEEADRDFLYMMVLRRTTKPDGTRHDFDEETIDARLMPLRKGIRYDGAVRETPIPSASRLMIRINAAPGRLLCPSKYRDLQIRKEIGTKKLQRIEALRAHGQGEPIREELSAFKAEALLDLGDVALARRECRVLIDTTTKTNLRLEAYFLLWESLMLSPVSDDETTKILLAGLDSFPVDMQLLTFMAGHLQRQGQLDLAVRTYETAVQHGRVSLDVWHRLHILEVAVTGLALAHRQRGDNEEAIRVLETNREHFEDRSEYDRHLLDLYIVCSDESKAHQIAASLWGDEELDRIRDVLSAACGASAGNWEEAVELLDKAYKHDCRDILCLRWYSLALMSLKRFDEAIPILEEWIAANPQGTEAKAFLFAAQHPERFTSILRQMRNVPEDRQSPATKGRSYAKRFSIENGALRVSEQRSPEIDMAVREMIRSSAKTNLETETPEHEVRSAEDSVLESNS